VRVDDDIGAALEAGNRVPGRGLTIAGGALIALGAVLPWVSVWTDYGDTPTESGLAAGDGILFLIVGILIAASGLRVVRDHPRAESVLLVMAGVAVVSLTALEFFTEIKERVESVSIFEHTSVGEGIYMLLVGAAVTALAGLVVAGEAGREHVTKVLAVLLGLTVVAVLALIITIAIVSGNPGPTPA